MRAMASGVTCNNKEFKLMGTEHLNLVNYVPVNVAICVKHLFHTQKNVLVKCVEFSFSKQKLIDNDIVVRSVFPTEAGAYSNVCISAFSEK